jgi:hypothetical protein
MIRGDGNGKGPSRSGGMIKARQVIPAGIFNAVYNSSAVGSCNNGHDFSTALMLLLCV